MMTVASRDEVVQPKESAWHEYWPWGDTNRDKIVNLLLVDQVDEKDQALLICNLTPLDHRTC